MPHTTPHHASPHPHHAVAEEQGDWFRIILHGRNNLWILSRNRVRAMVEPASGDAGTVWMKQRIGGIDSSHGLLKVRRRDLRGDFLRKARPTPRLILRSERILLHTR